MTVTVLSKSVATPRAMKGHGRIGPIIAAKLKLKRWAMSAEMEAIVLDNGSGVIKAGFSGEDAPRATFSACVGKVKNPEWFAAQVPSWKAGTPAAAGPTATSELLHERDTFVGTACQQYRDFLDVTHPIDRGVVEDWDALERIWEYVFAHELHIDPETCALPVRSCQAC